MSSWFLFFKALHIVAVIAWMAGLLYLYRLFVYHRGEQHPEVISRFVVMERRLWRAITVPAAWVAVLAGLAMLGLLPCHFLSQGWMTLKLLAVLGLLGVHFHAGIYRRRFAEGRQPLTERTFRILNELPTLLMILIVFLVIYQPQWWRWAVCG